jgi:hypothetical protein
MTFWTTENTEVASSLWRAGKSAEFIRGVIHAPSRSAVCGKLARLGLVSGKIKPTPEQQKQAKIERDRRSQRKLYRARTGAGSAAKFPAEPLSIEPVQHIAAPEELHLSLVELPFDACRWPTKRDEDGGPWLFCGTPAMLNHPYCAFHSAKASMNPRFICAAMKAVGANANSAAACAEG